MSSAQCSWPQSVCGLPSQTPNVLGILYFLWQKQQTSKRQAETGGSSCSCILLVLWSYWWIRRAKAKDDDRRFFRYSLANTTEQWKTETGEPTLALLALEHLWQISDPSKWQWQLCRERLWAQRISEGPRISAATAQVSQVLTHRASPLLDVPAHNPFLIVLFGFCHPK